MKILKSLSFICLLFVSIIFIHNNYSYAQECESNCTIVEEVEIPFNNDPAPQYFPPNEEPVQVSCNVGYFSDYHLRCMKDCPGENGYFEINQSCPSAAQPTNTQPQQPYYGTPPFNPSTNTGGVTVTYRPAQIYNTPIVYNTPVRPATNNTFVPTNWGIVSGAPQIYNPAPVYVPVVNTSLPRPPQIVCPINYTVSGQECAPNKKSCIDGSQVSFFEPCTKTCWSGTAAGQKIPENQTCPAGTNPAQVYNAPIIYNTPVRPVTTNTFVPTNWGGASGAAQFYATNTNTYNTNITATKVCKDGNTVYDYQTCTKRCFDGKVINENYICPVAELNHKVITTSATQITNNSARCNAVADISGMVNTTGYFEYGDTSSLGKSTNSGNIGYGDDIYYSNNIINLEPDTKYYCRAVIVNKDGVKKGEIVSFRTSANKKVYVSTVIEEVKKKEIIATPLKKGNTKKIVEKKVEVTCKDTEGNIDKLEDGEKFLDMRLENISNFISPLEVSDYKLEYKNRSNLNLENIILKITIPEGVTFLSSTSGVYNDGILTINVDNLKSNQSKIIDIKLKGDKNVQLGKNIIVQANASYDMLDEDGNTISDETSVYSISTVTGKLATIDNKISKETEVFWSGWLFKLLISLLLLVILYILGRNIYKKIIHKRHHDRILGHH